jgi:phospholipid transport system substrate-binding protein
MIMRSIELSIGRRFLVKLFAFAVLAAVLPAMPGHAVSGEDPSVSYIRKVTADLFAAHKQGTISAFLPPIQRHADIETIALYSLGQYESRPI